MLPRSLISLLAALSVALPLGGCCNKIPGLGKNAPAGSSSASSGVLPSLPSLPSLPGTKTPAETPSEAAPMPYATGQWARYRMVRAGQPATTFTYKVIGGGGNSPDFEILLDDPKGRKVIKMGVTFTDRHTASTWTIRSASVKLGPGKAIVLPPAARKSVDQILGGASISSPPFRGPRADCSAPAGKFVQCFHTSTATRVLNRTTNAKQAIHSAVPVLSMVRTEYDDGAVMELEAFGLSGATPEP